MTNLFTDADLRPTAADEFCQALKANKSPTPTHHNHRAAALDLLTNCPISHREAGFCGHVAVADDLTDKQVDWLVKLLARNGRPPLARGAAR